MDDILKAFFGAMLDSAGTADTIHDDLLFPLDNSSIIFQLINNIWGYFSIVGLCLTLIYFLMEMNTKYALEGRDMNFRTMFTPFLKLMIAIAVLHEGGRILGWLMQLHNTVVDYGFNHFTATENPMGYMAMDDFINSMGFFTKIFVGIFAFFAWVIHLVCSLVWGYKAIMFKLEYIYRVSISPIALSDIYSGQNANAIKWLKGFLALTLYGVSFIVLVRLGPTLVTATFLTPPDGDVGFLDALKFIAQMLIVPIAELSVLGAIKQATKEAVG